MIALAYVSRPLPSLVFICGDGLTDAIRRFLQNTVLFHWRKHNTILLGDEYGVDMLARKFCEQYGTSYFVLGTGIRARNTGSRRHYIRLPGKTYAQRDQECIAWADTVICVGESLLSRGKPTRGFTAWQEAIVQGKRVVWWSEQLGYSSPIGLPIPRFGSGRRPFVQLPLF